jgi:hypothetical protein
MELESVVITAQGKREKGSWLCCERKIYRNWAKEAEGDVSEFKEKLLGYHQPN